MEPIKKVPFTKEMKKTHTILIPTMLPIHFRILGNVLENYGYKVKVLDNCGPGVIEQGLKNVHNDTCYPAQLVIGQMIDALEHSDLPLDKVALLITQTGGGCRASNYIYLLRKALNKCGYGDIPVISASFMKSEQSGGFSLPVTMLLQALYGVLCGDLIMTLYNQCIPYEIHKGDSQKAVDDSVAMAEKLFCKKLLRWSTAVEEPRTKLLLSRCQQELGMQEQVCLMRCCLLDTPMLMGLWRPCILLPEVELEEQQLRYVLLHELSHRRRRDLWLKFLLLVAKAVHWFNPLVWWMARRASADIEVACDADVLRLHDTKEERREYGALILYFIQLSRERAIPLTTNFSEKGQIMRRFQEMMNTSKKRVGLLLFALICAAAVGSTAFVNLHVRAEEEPDLQLSEPMQQEMDILAAERAQTQQALDGQEEDEAVRRAEVAQQYAVYEPYGMSYDVEKDRFFYAGQMVRYFKDTVSADETNGFYFADGVIDVEPVRETGGALIGLKQSSEEEFANRTQQQQQMDAEFAAAGVSGESGSVELGDLFLPDDSLNDYRSFGVSYQASTGHWMYEGQPIHILYDEDHYTFCDNGVSDGVSLTVSRDAGGNIERLVPTDAAQLEEYVSADTSAQMQMIWPVPSTHEVSWPYGSRYDDTDFHTGLDIGDYSQEIYGEPVVAAADGTVAMVSEDWTPGRGYGMYLVIEHENGFATLYGHLSAIDVEEDDTVKAGEQIGQIGATGFATGPHLHFEVRVNGQHTDPMEYLPV